jgi:hypothetical protein
MRKSDRRFWLLLVGILAVVTILYVSRDLYLKSHQIACADGPRRTIDIRDFTMRYSAYSLKFEAAVENKGKLSGELDPVQLQSLTEATQQANEFRKFLVAGYNSCAVSQQDLGKFAIRFQALDGVARQISSLSSAETRDEAKKRALVELVAEYRRIVQELR